MLKKTIAYTDYNGVDRTEDFYFNISQAEIALMEMSVNGGLSNMLANMVATKDMSAISKFLNDLILMSYGEKSLDGKRFDKSDEKAKDFSQTEAYSQLFMELITNESEAADFVNGIIPNGKPKQLPVQ